MPTTVYKGPAQVEFGGYKFTPKGEVTVNMVPETFDVATDAYGTVDQRIKSRSFTIAFEPAGRADEEAVFLIAAAAERRCGVSVMGSSLSIKPFINGQPVLTFDRAGLTGIPELRLGASKTLYGNMTFTALETAAETTGNIATAGIYAVPVSSFIPSAVLTEPWTGIWKEPAGTGPSSMINLETEDGWTVNMEIGTEMSRADSVGITDILQTDCKITVSCIPVGLTEAQLLELVQRSTTGMGIKPGDSLHGRTAAGALDLRDLILTSRSGWQCLISKAGLKSGVLRYGAKVNRTGTLTFVALRGFASGNPASLFGFTAPEE